MKKKDKKKVEEGSLEQWEKELNIRYHEVNPKWNYTISPRSNSKQNTKNKK